MDLATLFGIIAGVGLIFFGMFSSSDGNLALFIDPASAAIVIGGAIAAVLTSSPMKEVVGRQARC